MKLTTTFRVKLAITPHVGLPFESPAAVIPAIDAERHQGLPLVRTHERAAAIAFQRNPVATHCIVSTKGENDARSYRRDSKPESEWQALRERKGT